MVKRTRVWLAALIAVFALIVAACASNDDEGPTGGTGTTAETGTTGATGETGLPSVHDARRGRPCGRETCLDYPPFESIKNGDEVGFDIDIVEEVGVPPRPDDRVEESQLRHDLHRPGREQVRHGGGGIDDPSGARGGRRLLGPYFNSRQALTINADESGDIASG